MSQFSKLAAILFERGDQRIAEALLAAVSISPEKLRSRLRSQGLVRGEPFAPQKHAAFQRPAGLIMQRDTARV